MKSPIKILLICCLFALPFVVNAENDDDSDWVDDLINFVFSYGIGKCMQYELCAIIVTPILVILFIIALPSCIQECKENPRKSIYDGCISSAGYYAGSHY